MPFVGSSVTLRNCEMASNNDLSPERQRERRSERSARNATGILRGGFAGGERERDEERERGRVKRLMFPTRETGGGAAETSSTTTMTLRAEKERETDVF